ncbi:Fe2+ transport system protein A [Belliella baltica DSM 15883]|uniref:Fe2+ transport system protein A n=1 Tax=Belliella baltica (strain DSM 15883 / CIP 108006 / LMG 21964 / BA134) TaxID=866536 RepID=I3Z7A8_BELBD|nr:FeoA family protein [Belliella baltica]AFL85126.1 Fe2+ transport system protein A [Belliella baltica DSM 15883]
MNASEISPNNTYLIKEIMTSDIDVNLLEIGVMEGKIIRLAGKTLFAGTYAFEVGENIICMRPSEAKLIMVIPQN